MPLVDVMGSKAGRVLRVAAGTGLILAGRRRRDRTGAAVAAVGAVPLLAGVLDVCLLGPLVGGPLQGADFRAARR